MIGTFLTSKGRTPTISGELARQLLERDWSVLTTSQRLNRVARLLDMLVQVWRQRAHYKVGHVAVYSGLGFIWAELVCTVMNLLKKPYVLSLEGGNLPQFAKSNRFRVQRLLESADEVTATSDYLRENMRAFKDNIRYMPAPIDILNNYTFRVRNNPQPKLIWLRSFHKIYNPLLAAEVIHLLRDEFPNLELVMVGPDKGDGSLQAFEQKIIDLKIENLVSCSGGIAKSEVPKRLSESDIFINTTNIDNTPVSVIEALASGLCVVSTNVGGIPYLLEHEQTAVLVPPNDSQAMAEAVRRILTEPGLAEHLSRNARAKAMQSDCSVVMPQWEKLFLVVAERHNR